jgi:hypothetical protein
MPASVMGLRSMAQIFHRSSNSLAKISIVAVLLLLCGTVWAAYKINAGSFITDVDVAPAQPVPFSHKHHVGDDGIDCRYCHTSVETSSFAGLPPERVSRSSGRAFTICPISSTSITAFM